MRVGQVQTDGQFEKTDQINAYVGGLLLGTRLLARSDATLHALRGFRIPHDGGRRPYIFDDMRLREYDRLMTESVGYYDLSLIDAAGNVLFTIRHESDFGANLNDEALYDSELATAHREALALLDARLTPVHRYAPSDFRLAIVLVWVKLVRQSSLNAMVSRRFMSDRCGIFLMPLFAIAYRFPM